MRRVGRWRPSSVAIGAAVVIVVAIGAVLAFTKELPWGDAYELKAVFSTSQSLRDGSPVRIAGVEVGEVVDVDDVAGAEDEVASDGADAAGSDFPDEGQAAALVTMEIEEAGRPIAQDATLQLRPRLFLEGNLFVDLKPGSPGAPEAEDGYTVPINQTSVSVQLYDVLDPLTLGVRRDLQVFLDEFGAALMDHGGGEGLQRFYRSSPGAFRYTSRVNEALHGQRRGDLAGVVRNLGRVAGALSRNEGQLQDLVTNLRVVTGSFAAEDVALESAVAELPRTLRAGPPAFANLNAAFPPLRSFAREALPGVRNLAPAVRAGTPFARQLKRLASRRELRGLVADLRPTVPRLARVSRRGVDFFEEIRALASCFNNVVIPWSNDEVDGGDGYPHPAVGPVYKETAYGLAGLAGESRSGDANGQYIRVNAGGGTNAVSFDPQGGAEPFFGLTPLPLEGAMPAIDSSRKTRFRPQRPCENQEPPDLRATAGPAPEPVAAATGGPNAMPGPIRAMTADLRSLIDGVVEQGRDEDLPHARVQRRFEREYERFLRVDFPRYRGRIKALGDER
jgi:phospholipid/cholesterol/gamma-HCH transport system substrate-binding protein